MFYLTFIRKIVWKTATTATIIIYYRTYCIAASHIIPHYFFSLQETFSMKVVFCSKLRLENSNNFPLSMTSLWKLWHVTLDKYFKISGKFFIHVHYIRPESELFCFRVSSVRASVNRQLPVTINLDVLHKYAWQTCSFMFELRTGGRKNVLPLPLLKS